MNNRLFRTALAVALLTCFYLTGRTEAQTPSCNIDGDNIGCIVGCMDCGDVASPGCDGDGDTIQGLSNAQNFFPVHLALVQAPDKINLFQQGCRDAFANKGVPPGKIKNITNVQDAIDEITAEAALQGGPIKVVICGHGSPGAIKVGGDVIDEGANLANLNALIAGIDGLVSELVLFGCSVGAGAAGVSLQGKIAFDLGIPVKAWTGTVYAYSNAMHWPLNLRGKLWHKGDKVVVPTMSEWGVVALALLTMSAATLVIMRRRAVVVS